MQHNILLWPCDRVYDASTIGYADCLKELYQNPRNRVGNPDSIWLLRFMLHCSSIIFQHFPDCFLRCRVVFVTMLIFWTIAYTYQGTLLIYFQTPVASKEFTVLITIQLEQLRPEVEWYWLIVPHLIRCIIEGGDPVIRCNQIKGLKLIA